MGKPLGRKQNIGIESRETMVKILAVDDEPAILEMIESILNKDGHLVTKVSNPLKINMEVLYHPSTVSFETSEYRPSPKPSGQNVPCALF